MKFIEKLEANDTESLIRGALAVIFTVTHLFTRPPSVPREAALAGVRTADALLTALDDEP